MPLGDLTAKPVGLADPRDDVRAAAAHALRLVPGAPIDRLLATDGWNHLAIAAEAGIAIIGGHTKGRNAGTCGIALIGNFMKTAPSDAAR